MDTINLLSEISILKHYIEWLETSLASYEPDWICDKMGDKDLCHDWCYDNCGEQAWTHDCFKKYYDNFVADRKTEPTISKMEQVEDEPQTIRCPNCGRSDYIREFGKDFSVTAEKAGFKYKCINCNTYIEPQTYVINPQEPTNDEKCFECDDFFTCGGKCNKIEDEPQTEEWYTYQDEQEYNARHGKE